MRERERPTVAGWVGMTRQAHRHRHSAVCPVTPSTAEAITICGTSYFLVPIAPCCGTRRQGKCYTTSSQQYPY